VRFFDASALVKRYLRELHSATVRRLLATGPVAISRLSEVEVTSGLARLEREGAITTRMRDRAVAAFAKDLAAWHVVELSSEVATLARVLLLRHPLRSGDVIQLASALRIQQVALEPLTAFVAYDVRLNAAAGREGLKTP
jgi:predicted nucleic acid-binding protein